MKLRIYLAALCIAISGCAQTHLRYSPATGAFDFYTQGDWQSLDLQLGNAHLTGNVSHSVPTAAAWHGVNRLVNSVVTGAVGIAGIYGAPTAAGKAVSLVAPAVSSYQTSKPTPAPVPAAKVARP